MFQGLYLATVWCQLEMNTVAIEYFVVQGHHRGSYRSHATVLYNFPGHARLHVHGEVVQHQPAKRRNALRRDYCFCSV